MPLENFFTSGANPVDKFMLYNHLNLRNRSRYMGYRGQDPRQRADDLSRNEGGEVASKPGEF